MSKPRKIPFAKSVTRYALGRSYGKRSLNLPPLRTQGVCVGEFFKIASELLGLRVGIEI